MNRNFGYEYITFINIEDNSHLIFICDGDSKKVILDREDENEHK